MSFILPADYKVENCLQTFIKSVLESGSEEDLNRYYDGENTLLHLACKNNLKDCIILLLDDARVDVNKFNKNGYTVLHNVSMDKDKFDIYLMITERSNVLYLPSATGITVLMFACYHTNINVVKLLLENPSVDPNAKDIHGRTAFFFACGSNNVLTYELVKILLENTKISVTDTDNDNESALMNMCCREILTHDLLDTIKLLLEDGRVDPNLRDNRGETLFYKVCSGHNNSELFLLLLNDERINVNMPNNEGTTPFEIVYIRKFLQKIVLMIENDRVNIDRNSELAKKIIRTLIGHDIDTIKKVIEKCNCDEQLLLEIFK